MAQLIESFIRNRTMHSTLEHKTLAFLQPSAVLFSPELRQQLPSSPSTVLHHFNAKSCSVTMGHKYFHNSEKQHDNIW